MKPMIRHSAVFVLLGLLAVLSLAADPQRNLAVAGSAGKRVALVIGNAAYPGAGALKNPANDARDIAAKLKKLGFDVTVRTDMRYRDMLRSLTEFGDKVQTGSEALFFFAGHGMQVRGKNYLIPIDAEIRNESSVSSEAVDVDQLLDKLSPARLSLVILDACRNNPFERRFRGGGQGLAQINAPTGTLMAYATAPGKVAADGEGRNGLYTSELLKAMDVAGIKVEDVFKRVRANVVTRSGNAQTPWESSSLTGDFYFRSDEGGVASTSPQSPSPAVSATIELAFWESIKNSSDPDDFQAYVDKYPNGQFIALAEKRARNKMGQQSAINPSLTESLPPLSTFKDCGECPEMVVIPPGSFEMGRDDRGEIRKELEILAGFRAPVHGVTLEKPFAMSRQEVTQRQWRALMGTNPSYFRICGDDCPVEAISWNDAKEFVRRLSEKTGATYRLPTEAEWEYSCRAGSVAYCGGTDLASSRSYAWVGENSGAKTHPVANKSPNAWGLYDMSGNVSEWVEDCWNPNYVGAPSNGSAWVMGECSKRVYRGGNWNSNGPLHHAAYRNRDAADARFGVHGLRVARTLKD